MLIIFVITAELLLWVIILWTCSGHFRVVEDCFLFSIYHSTFMVLNLQLLNVAISILTHTTTTANWVVEGVEMLGVDKRQRALSVSGLLILFLYLNCSH